MNKWEEYGKWKAKNPGPIIIENNMRDWDALSRNKIECNIIHFEGQLTHAFKNRHHVLDDLGIQVAQHYLRELRIWKQIDIKYGG